MSRAGTPLADARSSGPRMLVLRLSSMGDIIHALPAVAALKHSFPGSTLSWVIHPRWRDLLEGNPFVDQVIPLDRRSARSLREAWRALRACRCQLAVDFQGLVQSALIGSVARPDHLYGFHQSQVREKPAALFYSNRVLAQSPHVVDRNLELVRAAGASTILRSFALPEGAPEGELPDGDFVLACPLAGWGGKQWPLERYGGLARRLRREFGAALVLNGPPAAASALAGVPGAHVHLSGIRGLIWATRRAAGIVGNDSGPMHLAAALGRPGVAIFGPTDPARNGPYGGTFSVLRHPDAATTYRRRTTPDDSMLAIGVDEVFEALRSRIGARRPASA